MGVGNQYIVCSLAHSNTAVVSVLGLRNSFVLAERELPSAMAKFPRLSCLAIAKVPVTLARAGKVLFSLGSTSAIKIVSVGLFIVVNFD